MFQFSSRLRRARRLSILPKGPVSLTFPELESKASTATNQTRFKRQLAEHAIQEAARANWADAAETNRKLIAMGPDPEAENRLAKALWELGEIGSAREHYQTALALDPT